MSAVMRETAATETLPASLSAMPVFPPEPDARAVGVTSAPCLPYRAGSSMHIGDYVRDYHSRSDGTECDYCDGDGEDEYGDPCDECGGDISDESDSRRGHDWDDTAPPMGPFASVAVGVELEVGLRKHAALDYMRSSMEHLNSTAEHIRRTTDITLVYEEDSSLPDDGFEVISDYGPWPVIAPAWLLWLHNRMTQYCLSGFVDHRRVDVDRTDDDGDERMPWAGLRADITYDTVSPYRIRYEKPGSAQINDPRRAAPYGMHVHLSMLGAAPSGALPVANTMRLVLCDLLNTNPSLYLFLMGRPPNKEYCCVEHSNTRYGLVAARSEYGTVEVRGFASTLNPQMFAARVELSMLLFVFARGGSNSNGSASWSRFEPQLLEWSEHLPNLTAVLQAFAADGAPVTPQESMPQAVAPADVSAPAVSGKS